MNRKTWWEHTQSDKLPGTHELIIRWQNIGLNTAYTKLRNSGIAHNHPSGFKNEAFSRQRGEISLIHEGVNLGVDIVFTQNNETYPLYQIAAGIV